MTMEKIERAAVYRFFAADGTLLYVGVTQRVGTRWSNHAKQKPWWAQVARQEVVWYATRAEALLIEEAAIKAEKPTYNVQHMPKAPEPRVPASELDHTHATRFRLPRRMWDTYGRVLGDRDRSADLLDHVRAVINARGNAHDLAELNAAEEELAERRSRKGGRPPKAPARPDPEEQP